MQLRYRYDANMNKQQRFVRRYRFFIILFVVALVGIIAWILWDALRQGDQKPSSSETTTSFVSSNTITFENEHFTFTVPNTWRDIPKESSAQKYVYRSYRGELVEEELDVYINSSGEDTSAVRVLPVTYDSASGKFTQSEISDHCSTKAGTKAAYQPVRVSIADSSLMCQIDGTNYLVVVGLKGGSEAMQLQGPGGKNVQMTIFYRNSIVPPESEKLVKLINQFKVL